MELISKVKKSLLFSLPRKISVALCVLIIAGGPTAHAELTTRTTSIKDGLRIFSDSQYRLSGRYKQGNVRLSFRSYSPQINKVNMYISIYDDLISVRADTASETLEINAPNLMLNNNEKEALEATAISLAEYIERNYGEYQEHTHLLVRMLHYFSDVPENFAIDSRKIGNN